MNRSQPGRRGAGIALAVVLAVVPLTPAAAQVGSPAGPVPAAVLEARRQALLDRIRPGAAVIHSADLRGIERDHAQDSDFRQSNELFYLTGLETPSARLLMVAPAAGKDQVILFLRRRDPGAERWTGPRLGPGAEAARLTGVQDVRPADAFQDVLGSLVSEPDSPVHAGALWMEEPPCAPTSGSPHVPPASCVSESLGGVRVAAVGTHLDALRLVKDDEELRRLRRAVEITVAAQRAAMRAARPGLFEYELEAVIEYVFRAGGAERVGFPSIVGSGPNSTVLHYDRNRRRMEAGDLVVMDIGAEYGYYTADVTRTIPVSGTFTERQRALYRLVLGAQQAAIDAVHPGVTVSELDRIARTFMRDHSGALCGERSCDAYFVHGLSHWLGMDVHDVGGYGTPLAPGMVLTVEPGLYIPGEGIGIRIEDDVLVTATGAVVLSEGAPKDPDAVEALMVEDVALTVGGRT